MESDQADHKDNGDGGEEDPEKEEDFVDAISSLPCEDAEEAEREKDDSPQGGDELDRTEFPEPGRPVEAPEPAPEALSLEEGGGELSDGPEKSPKRQRVEEKVEEEEENLEVLPKKEKQSSSMEGEHAAEKEEEEEEEDGEKSALNGSTPSEDGTSNGFTNGVHSGSATPAVGSTSNSKKSSKKKNSNNVWVTKSTRKGKKKSKTAANNNHNNASNGHGSLLPLEDKVLITPIPRFPDRSDDSPEMNICLSRVYKAEKVELSEDRLTAGSTKGYRMVRATRGVIEGAWYFEIKVVSLGETGHTRLGWTTEKGDLQAPVGYDGNSFGYRDVDGSKVHKALREKYGEEGYKEGDVIGCYLSLPEGENYAPKQMRLVWYKGQRYICGPDSKEDPAKVVPGSEISFFKNGVCQGVAFKDLQGGRYYPAASMYTLPNQPNCEVRFNFGPDFEFFPDNFEGRPIPKPMVKVPYQGHNDHVENGGLENGGPVDKKH